MKGKLFVQLGNEGIDIKAQGQIRRSVDNAGGFWEVLIHGNPGHSQVVPVSAFAEPHMIFFDSVKQMGDWLQRRFAPTPEERPADAMVQRAEVPEAQSDKDDEREELEIDDMRTRREEAERGDPGDPPEAYPGNVRPRGENPMTG